MPDGLLRFPTRQGFILLEAFPTSLGKVPDGLSITGVMRKEEGWFRTPHRSGPSVKHDQADTDKQQCAGFGN